MFLLFNFFKYLELVNGDEKNNFVKIKPTNRGRKVVQYDLNMNVIKVFDSIADASKKLNIHKNNIWGIITNYRKTAGGFIFKYLE